MTQLLIAKSMSEWSVVWSIFNAEGYKKGKTGQYRCRRSERALSRLSSGERVLEVAIVVGRPKEARRARLTGIIDDLSLPPFFIPPHAHCCIPIDITIALCRARRELPARRS